MPNDSYRRRFTSQKKNAILHERKTMTSRVLLRGFNFFCPFPMKLPRMSLWSFVLFSDPSSKRVWTVVMPLIFFFWRRWSKWHEMAQNGTSAKNIFKYKYRPVQHVSSQIYRIYARISLMSRTSYHMFTFIIACVGSYVFQGLSIRPPTRAFAYSHENYTRSVYK